MPRIPSLGQRGNPRDDAETWTEQELSDFLFHLTAVKHSKVPLEGRSAYLEAFPDCDKCLQTGKPCTPLKKENISVRCEQCVAGTRVRCPRQTAFDIAYIAKKMSKSVEFVTAIHAVHDRRLRYKYCPIGRTTHRRRKQTEAISISSDGDSQFEFSEDDGLGEDSALKDKPKIEGSTEPQQPALSRDEEEAIDVAQQLTAAPEGLVILTKTLALRRSFIENTFKPFAGDVRATKIAAALKKLETIGKIFSNASNVDDFALMEDLTAELAVCRDQLCKAIDSFGDDAKEKFQKHLEKLKEIILGFAALLDQDRV